MGTGHHYGMPPEVVYTPAVVTLASDALTYIIRTVHKTLYQEMDFTGIAVWQGYPPRHFQGGDWDSGGKCVINDSIENVEEVCTHGEIYKSQNRKNGSAIRLC